MEKVFSPPSKEHAGVESGKQFFRFTFLWHVAKESERRVCVDYEEHVEKTVS